MAQGDPSHAPFCIQIPLISPTNSCENLTDSEEGTGGTEGSGPIRPGVLQPILNRTPASLRSRSGSGSSKVRLLNPCSWCRYLCDLHISKMICVGLIGLFIFNMALYGYIFYRAHVEGHDFK